MATATRRQRKEVSAAPAAAAAPPGGARLLPVVLLFIGSGCAALVYEVVWFQLLTLVIGSSAFSLAVVLGTFMGGMCAGSLLLPRVIGREAHPLRVYAVLEAAIAVCGLLVLVAVPVIGRFYTAIGGAGMPGLILRALVCAVCLLPPTLLMGATLPAIARWVEATPRGVSWLGFFYGGNIAGAVAGSLLAGYYLLRVYDMPTATAVAMLLNLAVAGAALLMARRTTYVAPAPAAAAAAGGAEAPAEGAAPLVRRNAVVYTAIALSGMTALASEVVWTRLLSLMLGATVYTFSLILAVFLLGLGIGSSAGAALGRSVRHPRLALGLCQLGVVAGIAWAAYSIAHLLPYWPVNPALAVSPWFTFQLDFVRAAWVSLPGAVFWGMSFPLALAAVGLRAGEDPGRLIGTVYAANTVGAIVGAVLSALVAISWMGTQNTQRVLLLCAAASALLLLVPHALASLRGWRGFAIGGGIAAAAVALAASVPAVPPLLIAYGRYMVTWLQQAGEVIYWGEGMNSSMAVSRLPNGVLNYHNAGKVQASSEPQDMRLQRMLGHLTTLVPDNPRSVLVIGFGAGATAGAVSVDPAVERLTIAEIEPLVPKVVSTYFSAHNFDVARQAKTRLVYDDARHFLLTTDERFDAITSDPFDPWVKGAATLYTREFFQEMKDHLTPGGVVTVFVQLYESGMAAVKSEIATFFEVFPDGMVFGNTYAGGGYDVVLLGRKDGTPIDIDRVNAKLARPEYAPVAASLGEIGFYGATDLFGRYAGSAADLRPWLADAQVNRDRNLRLQYLAGMGINAYEQALIYDQILAHRRPPGGTFTGSAATLEALHRAFQWRY